MIENLAASDEIERQQTPGRRLSVDELNRLAESGDWYEGWLHNLHADIPGFTSMLLAVESQGMIQPVSLWPHDRAVLDDFGDLVDACCQRDQPIMIPPRGGSPDYGIAYPVRIDNRIRCVFAGFIPLDDSSIEPVMMEVEKHCVWIECRLSQDDKLDLQRDILRQREVIDGYVAVGKGEAFKESALHWADTLARDFGADQVSLGMVKNGVVSLAVISGSSDHVFNSVTTKQIVRTMQEACDQRSSISSPPIAGKTKVSLQAEKLSFAQHNASILSLPVYHDDEPYLVVTFERSSDAPFSAEEIERIEACVALVGIAFHHRQEADLSFWAGVKKHIARQLERLVAPGYTKRKLFVIGSLALFLFFALARGEYQINADAVLEPWEIRIVSAPFAGYLKNAPVRAGDRVDAGSVLATMEDNELRLEKIKALSLLAQNKKQYTDALAASDRSQAQIYAAQMAQAKAQIDAAENKLRRSVMRAPFDALVVSGDLSQKIGGALNQGDELYRLSPMSDYRLTLLVSEFRIGQVEVGQVGRVVLSSMPDQSFPFEIEKLTPVTEVRDGSTLFRVEARLQQSDAQFRPGLVGIGKISAGERHLIDMWTQDLRTWLAMKFWSFWG